jgi:hypothetical protein
LISRRRCDTAGAVGSAAADECRGRFGRAEFEDGAVLVVRRPDSVRLSLRRTARARPPDRGAPDRRSSIRRGISPDPNSYNSRFPPRLRRRLTSMIRGFRLRPRPGRFDRLVSIGGVAGAWRGAVCRGGGRGFLGSSGRRGQRLSGVVSRGRDGRDPIDGGGDLVGPGPGRWDGQPAAALPSQDAGAGAQDAVAQPFRLDRGQLAVQGDQLQPAYEVRGDRGRYTRPG